MITGSGTITLESAASLIGLITLAVKLAGKPGTGKPYAGFDEAGVGNGLPEYRANPRPYLRGERGRKAPDLPGILGYFFGVDFYDCPRLDLWGPVGYPLALPRNRFVLTSPQPKNISICVRYSVNRRKSFNTEYRKT